MRLFKPQHIDQVTDDIIKQILKVNFWVGFIGWYQIFKFVSDFLEG